MRIAVVAAPLMLSWMALAATANAAEPAEPLPEVEINAQREKLSVMRAEMVKLEDRFYADYNRLNTDDEFDIVCGMEAATGTKLKSRVCKPVFVNRATEEEALAFLTGRPVKPAMITILAKSPAYEKNVLDIVNKHPELRKLVRQRESLEKRYERVRKQKFKGKLIVLD
jgi:hypothetical protein